MPHQAPLISTIVIALALAWVFAALANRFELPPIVGYLLAGIAIGPFTPGFVADQHIASQLAEIGVILLMFGVGLHFSLADLLSVKAIAIPGAIAQIVCATLLGMALGLWLGWLIEGATCLGSRCRWRAPSCCCARFRNAAWSRPNAGASPWAG
jgi:monovalent cation:H+ antiporter-2, CPA2 family